MSQSKYINCRTARQASSHKEFFDALLLSVRLAQVDRARELISELAMRGPTVRSTVAAGGDT